MKYRDKTQQFIIIIIYHSDIDNVLNNAGKEVLCRLFKLWPQRHGTYTFVRWYEMGAFFNMYIL